MPEESAHLILAIDASQAKDGSLQFQVAANQVKMAADGMSKSNIAAQGANDRMGSSLETVSRKLMAYAAAYFSLREIANVTFAQEEAEYALAAAINLTGDARTNALANLKSFAIEVQKLTTYDDALILKDMAYAKNLGIVDNQLKNVTISAIGLSAKYNIDLETAILSISRASQGLPVILRGTAINLDDCSTAQEKYNKLCKLGADAFRLATEQAASASGSWKQIKNELSEVAEAFGQLMLPGVKQAKSPVIAFLEDLKWKLDEIPVSIQTAKTNIANLASAGAGWWNNPGATFGNLGSTLSGSMVTADETRKQIADAQAIQQKAEAENQRIKAMMLSRQAGTSISSIPENPIGLTLEEQKAQAEAVMKLYSDMYSGMKTSGVDYYDTVKQYDDKYRQAFLESLDIQKKDYEKSTKDKALVDAWYNNQVEQFNKKLTEEDREVVFQRAQITSDMYESMQNYGDEYYNAQKAILDQQYVDYSKFIKDKALLDEWYKNQLQKVQMESSYSWQQFKGVIGDTTSALSDFFMSFSDGENVVQTFAKSMQRMFANIASQMVMYQALTAMGMNAGAMGVQNPIGSGSLLSGFMNGIGIGAGTGAGGVTGLESSLAGSGGGGGFTDLAPISFSLHSGGIVGTSSSFGRRIPDGPAIRLHDGLAPDEYRAILQRGEKVQSKAQVAADTNKQTVSTRPQVNVRIINVSHPDEIPDAMAGAKGETIIMNHLRRNGVI